MRSVFTPFRRVGWALPVFFLAVGAPASDPYTEVDGEKKPLIQISRPAESTPEAQLQHADTLYQEGKLKNARKAYGKLVKRWPRSPEAVKAQASYASILVSLGKLRKAFDSYQELVENYAGRFPYGEVLSQQLRIAQQVATQRRGKFLFFPGLKSPEKAIKMYAKIVKNGPRWDGAPEAQMMVGRIQEETKEYNEAIGSYMQAMIRYPDSPFAEEAAFGRIRCLAAVSDSNINDMEAAEEGWHAIGVFNAKYPNSRFQQDIEEMRHHLYRRLAHAVYKIGEFYDKSAKKPKAAIQEYEKLIKRFPNSEWTEEAKQSIHRLQMELEGTSEK